MLSLTLALGACGQRPDRGPIDVSVIGAPLSRPLAGDAADRGPLDAPAAALAMATHEGLVRLDADGQLSPGLAVRWSVAGDGRSILFRLADGPPAVPAGAIVARLRRAIAAGSRNPLRPLLGAIDSVEAVTPQVIDIELRAPRPTLLPLFAQPALAIGPASRGGGPFAVARFAGGVATLRALPDPDADPDQPGEPPLIVRLRGERAGRAVARFAAGRAAFVTGGSFADLAVARAGALPADRLRFDPVAGLFGFAVAADAGGVAASPDGRRALAAAIDRDRIGSALDAVGWTPALAVLPQAMPEIAAPTQPDWATLPLAERRAVAAATVARLRGEAARPLRVAMPDGPGARLVFALVQADWRAIGVEAIAVAPDSAADLTLVDEIAPADTAAFYLRRFACERGVACTPEGDAALAAAREAPSLGERAAMLERADALIAAAAPYVPIGSPIRWSLVDPSLDRYAGSPRGLHPLDALRGARPR